MDLSKKALPISGSSAVPLQDPLTSLYDHLISELERLLATCHLSKKNETPVDEALLQLRLWHKEVSRTPGALELFNKSHPGLAVGVRFLLENVLAAVTALTIQQGSSGTIANLHLRESAIDGPEYSENSMFVESSFPPKLLLR